MILYQSSEINTYKSFMLTCKQKTVILPCQQINDYNIIIYLPTALANDCYNLLANNTCIDNNDQTLVNAINY